MTLPGAGSFITLGLHPSSRGFGWAAFTDPLHFVEGGVYTVKSGDKNVRCLARVDRLIRRLRPETIILEAFDGPGSRRSKRVKRLYHDIMARAAGAGIQTVVFGRGDIRYCFAQVGARTRHEIAEAVARSVPALRSRLPKKRRAWDSEDKRMAIFCAGALVLTHFRLDAGQLLAHLSCGA